MTGEEIVRELFSEMDWNRGRRAPRDTERTCMMPGDVGLLATLLNSIFVWATGPDGWEKMSVESKIEAIHAAIKIETEKDGGDSDTIDVLFDQYRQLSKRTGT